jgi:3',5'-cyclic-nucleotide phosphodiesterase
MSGKTVRFRVLGCSGGIGGGLHTTSFLVDDDILIDAGTGVTRLSREELTAIDHIFLTHSHLDHLLCVPVLLDSVGSARDHPITLHAIPEVLDIFRAHVFNWKIWPDFTQIPVPDAPFLRYREIRVGEPVAVRGRSFTAIPANHVVPAVGYHLKSGTGSLLFSGDTTSNPALWDYANSLEDLRHLIVEVSFTDAHRDIAIASKHFHPELFCRELVRLKRNPDIHITHLKPGEEETIMAEILAGSGARTITPLRPDQVLTI